MSTDSDIRLHMSVKPQPGEIKYQEIKKMKKFRISTIALAFVFSLQMVVAGPAQAAPGDAAQPSQYAVSNGIGEVWCHYFPSTCG